MLQWFDDNPGRHWCLVYLAVASALFLMLQPLLRPGRNDAKRTDWAWGLVILGLLFAGRWPTLFVAKELNTDESALIAGAITLRHDPMFWRSVDGATAGPLDFYALLPVGWIHGTDDYFAARLTALCLIAAALTFAHQTIALAFGKHVARIAGFSTVCFESLTQHGDLLDYGSELVPICLVAAAFFLGARRFVANSHWRWSLVGGAILGVVPFAKLQAAPLAALIGAGWIAGELWRRRQHSPDWRQNLTALCVGAGMPALVAAVALTFSGQWHAAVVSYFSNNITYVMIIPCRFEEVIGYFFLAGFSDNDLPIHWLGGASAWLFLSLPLARNAARFDRLLGAAAIALCGASLLCIFLPFRPFVHYWQLLVVPLTLVLGAITGLTVTALEKQPFHFRCAVLCAALFCTTGGLLYAIGKMPNRFVGQLAWYQTHPQGAVAQVIGEYASPGEALGVWGNLTCCYVETGMRQATRDAHSEWEILAGPRQGYFRQRYLADIRLSAPPVFVDTVGPGNLRYQDRRQAHDSAFPELAAYVREHYTLVAEVTGDRIYVRNDRLAAARR